MTRISSKEPRTVGGITFNSKAELIRYLSAMLARYMLYAPIAGADAAFLRDLLNYHPRAEAKLKGRMIARFEKHPNKGGSTCFYLVRDDGSREEFSFKKCADEIFA